MYDFYVDLEELTRTAKVVRELGRSFAASASLEYVVAATAVGNEGLARALAEFHEHSRRAADHLCADMAETADRLRCSVEEYRSHDQACADLITGLDRLLDLR